MGRTGAGQPSRADYPGRMSRAACLPPVLLGLVILLLAQMVGLGVSALLGLPIPGVVLGIVLLVLLGVLPATRGLVRRAEPAATPLLAHLQLLFVPPGVGIILELQVLAENALPLALAVGGSFALTLVVSGLLLQALLRRQDRRRGEKTGADGTAGTAGTAGTDGTAGAEGTADADRTFGSDGLTGPGAPMPADGRGPTPPASGPAPTGEAPA